MLADPAAILPPEPDALPHLAVPPPGPQSRQWLERLRRVESADVTAIAEDFPIVWASARGSAVRDVDGNTYVDATSAFGVALIGHAHPRVVAAAQRQAASLVHGMGDVHPPAVKVQLLEALVDRAPGDLGHAVLCTGGSEAVEVAQKTALLATGRPGIIAFSGSYHGLGHGALDVTSRRDFRHPFHSQLARNTVWVPYPNLRLPPHGVRPEDVLEHILSRVEELVSHPAMGGVPIGAILVEPIQGRGGSLIPPAGFLQGLRRICNQHDVLLILDEIFTGLGRTGRWFACEAEEVVPDLLCVGKALGGGLPIAACLGRPEAMRAWGTSTGEARHTSTFLGHPVACAAALETLRVLADEQVPQRAAEEGELWRQGLADRLLDHPWVADVRGRGLMLGVELRDPATGEPGRALAWRTVVGAMQRGVLLLPCGVHGHVLQLTPPVGTTPEQRAVVVDVLAAVLEAGVAEASS